MAPERVRLTRSGWIALTVAGVLVVAGLAVLVVRLTRPPDCSVRSADATVGLDQREAERAAAAAAAVVRRGAGTTAARTAVARATRASPAEARVVADALTGHTRAALSCRHGGSSTSQADALDAHGLTGRAERVREDILGSFG